MCAQKTVEFNVERWEGMLGRLRQMVLTNSNEHKINWALKMEDHTKRHRMIKSVANMLYVRGEDMNEMGPK